MPGFWSLAAVLSSAALSAQAALTVRSVQHQQACEAADLQHRVQFQNKLAGVCEDMCKKLGAYPKCNECPKFVEPDSTPGVMTWDELLDHMDNLVSWGQDQIKGWHKQTSAIQMQAKGAQDNQGCAAQDSSIRAKIQNKLAGVCEEMCKKLGAYPKCNECPKFVEPDSTPGVMTWDELLDHMDNLVSWGQDQIKGWHKQASAIQMASQEEACSAEDLKRRVQLQNKLAGACEEMCKEVGAYPKCAQCPKFVEPDSTPGVMTWEELLEHMDNLVSWGQDQIKGWHKQAAKL